MNYKIINTNTNESLITDKTGLTGVIAAHCAPWGAYGVARGGFDPTSLGKRYVGKRKPANAY